MIESGIDGEGTPTDGLADRERRVASARTLVDLALDFADRAQAVEAALIAEFRDAAAALAEDVGPVVVESDEDEQLLLRSDGALAGEVLDDDTGEWRSIESPEDVASYYDPTDLFLDLADTLVERFPELGPEFPEVAEPDGGWPDLGEMTTGTEGPPPGAAPGGAIPGEGDLAWTPDGGVVPGSGDATSDERPAIAATLENLHRSGVLSDMEFERLKAQLGG